MIDQNKIPHSCQHVNDLDLYLSYNMIDIENSSIDIDLRKKLISRAELCKKEAENIKQINIALRSKNDSVEKKHKEIYDIIDRFWKFDDSQTPTSSWHDKQDCLKYINETLNK